LEFTLEGRFILKLACFEVVMAWKAAEEGILDLTSMVQVWFRVEK